MSGRHEHEAGGPDDGAPDWFKVLDIMVWAAIVILVALAAEWAWGTIVRERLARQAGRFLEKSTPAASE
jgi:hypothetical protein